MMNRYQVDRLSLQCPNAAPNGSIRAVNPIGYQSVPMITPGPGTISLTEIAILPLIGGCELGWQRSSRALANGVGARNHRRVEPVTRKRNRTRKARPTRAKRPRVTISIKVTTKALLLVVVLWLTVMGASPTIVSAFIR